MPRLYRRIPHVVEAERFVGEPVAGMERRIRQATLREHGKNRTIKHVGYAVCTPAGWMRVEKGDWVLTDSDGCRTVLPDSLFRLGYEPLEG